MGYEISEQDNNTVLVKFTGDIHLKEREMARDEIFSLCTRKSLKYVLLDMRDSKMLLNMNDIINYVDSTASHENICDLRISGIMSLNDTVNNLIQTFLSSTRLNIKFFYSYDEAINWLYAIRFNTT